MIDSPALEWGVHIHRVEIKDVSLPEAMRRSIARQAEAERERRSRIISADSEYQASQKLSQAAQAMSKNPSALQLRLFYTVTAAVAAEKNSTLVLPFPVELLRFVDNAQNDHHTSSEKVGTYLSRTTRTQNLPPPTQWAKALPSTWGHQSHVPALTRAVGLSGELTRAVRSTLSTKLRSSLEVLVGLVGTDGTGLT